MRACGVDGCKIGWFYFELEHSNYEFGVCKTFKNLLNQVPKSKKILVDIPIGLPYAKANPRLCDVEARKMLGPRRSSIFPAPIREVLNTKSYEEANIETKRLKGKGLSKQTYGIMPKIIEVDQVLQSDLHIRKFVREAHPEICFLSLANGKPMQFNKKTQEGFRERIEILINFLQPTEQVIEDALQRYHNFGIARDDIVDAMVLAVIAAHPYHKIESIPRKPQFDTTGLPMQMVFKKNAEV